MSGRSAFILLLVCASCVPPRRVFVPWKSLPTSAAPAERADTRIIIDTFTVTNRGPADAWREVDALGDAFTEHLRRALGNVRVDWTDCLAPSSTVAEPAATLARRRAFMVSHPHRCERDDDSRPSDARLVLDVVIRPDFEDHRSFIWDVPFFASPFGGGWPLTPRWGRTSVGVHIELARSSARVEPIDVTVSAPFDVIFYSWYRKAPIEASFLRAYEAAFAEVARRLARRIDVPVREVATSTAHAAAPSRVENLFSTLTIPELVTIALSIEPEHILLREEGFRVVAQPIARKRDENFLSRYFGSLGGLEGSLTGGLARVWSTADTENGKDEIVATGNASTRGWGVAFFRPPDRTGAFFPPRFGFFSRDIDIEDADVATPIFHVAGAKEIPAIASRPETGEAFDLADPILYSLKLRSGYVGQMAGFNLVLGNDDVQTFVTTYVGVNVLEVRSTQAVVAGATEEEIGVAPFGAGQVGAEIGVSMPAIHLALRSAAELEVFRPFSFEKPLEFRAGVSFNEADREYRRQYVDVTGAWLMTFNWQVSVIALF